MRVTRSGPGSQSGTVLLLSLTGLFLVTALCVGVLTITASAIHTSRQQLQKSTALNIAESGAENAALWLKKQSIPPSGTADLFPFGTTPITLGNGTYVALVRPDPNNPSNFLKSYTILCTGTSGGLSKTVEIVVRQASFGRYAYFTDKETSSVSGGAIWWKAGELVDGPIHSNNASGSNFNINYNGSKAPIFLDMLTAAGSTINYSPSRPKDEATFKKVFLNGSKGYKLGVDPIALPASSDAQKTAAWGGSAGYPSSDGVYLRAAQNGGIYVRGDCTMSLSATGNSQVVTIKQGTKTTVVTINLATGQVTTSGPMGSGSATSASSLPNGTIYCTGNITSLSGTLADNRVVNAEVVTRSAMTIATDVNAGKDITITDNLVYKTKPDKTKSSTDSSNLAAGTLGLVSRNITISSSAPQNLEIDAVMMAGSSNSDGSFSVSNYDSKKPVGTLKVLGGIIQRSRGPVGTFDSRTGVTTAGYSKNYVYDPRMADIPPPFYPTTGQYDRLSWRVVPDDE